MAPRKRNAIVASARPIKLDDARSTRETIGRRQEWQNEAWAYFDEVAEVKFGSLYLGNGMSKVTFYAAARLDDGSYVDVLDDSSPIAGSPLAKQAVAEMGRLRSTLGGQAELNRQGAINWSVAGEYFIHGIEAKEEQGVIGTDDFKPFEPEQWEVRSVSEVELQSGGGAYAVVKVRDSPEGRGRTIDPETETLIRMWTRHARWSALADCHMRGLLSDCEALTLMVNQQKAEAKSRQAPGLLLVPSELSFKEDDEGGDSSEQPEQDPFLASLLKALTEPIEDPSAASAVMPLVVSGPAEFLTPDRFRLLSFARVADSTLDARIEAKINRIARGLNVPVEVVLGHMSTTFSNAEQIDEDVFTDHFEPLCMAMADAYASGFLHPQLQSTGDYDPEELGQVTVWFDASALVRGPSVTDSAELMHDRGTISDDAYRRFKGASDEDQPEPVDFFRWLLVNKAQFNPEITVALLDAVGMPIGLTPEDVKEEDPAAPAPTPGEEEEAAAPPPFAIAAASRSPQPLGRRLYMIDRDLRTKLLAAAEAAMARALERAGGRLRGHSKALTAALRSVPAKAACAHYGRAMVAAAGITDEFLLDSAWDEFEIQFKGWSLEAVDATLAVLAEVGVAPAERLAMARRYRAQIDDAWEWLSRAMTARAKDVLYAPEPLTASLVAEQYAKAHADATLATPGSADWKAEYDWAYKQYKAQVKAANQAKKFAKVAEELEALDKPLSIGGVEVKNPLDLVPAELEKLKKSGMYDLWYDEWSKNPTPSKVKYQSYFPDQKKDASFVEWAKNQTVSKTVTVGEVDLNARVPAGIVRESMAKAGGSGAVGGKLGVVEPVGNKPVGGIATGADAMAAVGDNNAGFVWVYGPAARSVFHPHLELDGVFFTNFDSFTLANVGVWPPTAFFYPGDHDGCLCDAEPILLSDPGASDYITSLTEKNRLRREYVEWAKAQGLRPDGNIASIAEALNTMDPAEVPFPLNPKIDPLDLFRDADGANRFLRDEMQPGVLTTAQQKAVRAYCSSSYHGMNAHLRGQDSADYRVQGLISDLKEAIDASKPLPRPVTASRVIGNGGKNTQPLHDLFSTGDAAIGSVVEDPGFMSVTLSKALHGTGPPWGWKLQLTLPAGTKSIAPIAGDLTGFTHESEIILQAGSKYTITKVDLTMRTVFGEVSQ